MANRPTLTEIKMHSRIDTDYEDDYLIALDNSAFDFIRTYLNRDLVLDNTAELIEGQIYYTEQMRVCELMLVDSWYTNRSSSEIPKACEYMLNQFRVMNT